MKKWIMTLMLACAASSMQAEPSAINPTAPPADQRERTLSIIKPDATKDNHIGEIIARFEKNGLKVVAIKMTHLDKGVAGEFYVEHKDRPFYPQLVDFMSSAPVVLMVLEGDNAVAKNREIMGATNPKDAAAGTIRKDFARSITENAVHGSDSRDSARAEITYFFKPSEIFSR